MPDFKPYRFAISHREDEALCNIANAARELGATDVFLRLKTGTIDSIVVDGVDADTLESSGDVSDVLYDLSHTREFDYRIEDEYRDDGLPCAIIVFK